ncbi:sulfite exporter TauE/SafE family protein [Mycobacterium sp.]|uniref:sulfite exporter TauE/SafE family protein n=1 Tax=Mycobacterium sp. TaxID=1785 RepID=UPI0031D17F15
MSVTQVAAVSAAGIGISVPLGFVIGLSLGTLGGGGSMLAVPALVYGVGQTAHAATTTSLVAVGSVALVGMVGHLSAGRVRLASGVVFGLVGVGGSFLGSLLSRAVPGEILLLAFAALILVAAWRMRGRHDEMPQQKQHPASATTPESAAPNVQPNGVVPSARLELPAQEACSSAVSARRPARSGLAVAVRVVIAGSVVGFLTGFFGVGGGFIIVPALVLALGYEMPVAAGTSLLVIAISSAEGLLFHLSSGGVDAKVAIPFTAAGLVGVLLGDRIAGRVAAASLSRWFVWLLLAVAVYTATESLVAL